ncbi:Longitudinals lacking protein, isoforms J/P/Q/S/Z [Orchesella cincta]|uniref:Longitudinals lacking protein, isoforms J/P/Q/S/Z n=1 Tax=Orchesella cincta TaxID=48709 RepID=A0A1D2M529_ORCCI|nr:Longitudinals lacking protein, isoforms J/P/Q/S/Z [Orchesella cincta]
MSVVKGFHFQQSNHSTILLQQISRFLKQGQFLDVSLMSNGQVIRCHRLVLSAFSPYLAQIISSQSASDLVIHFQEIEIQELEALSFMYLGEVTVSCDTVELFVRAAEKLKIVGLAGTIHSSITNLLYREGAVGDHGLESGSEFQQQQDQSQNVQKCCNIPDTCRSEQQQGKRNAASDPQQGICKKLGCHEITIQNRATVIGSNSPMVKIPPATVTSQSTSGSATFAHFSGGSTCIPATVLDKGLDLSTKIPKTSSLIPNEENKGVITRHTIQTGESQISISEQMEKAARGAGRAEQDFRKPCVKYGASMDEVGAYVMRQLELLQPQSPTEKFCQPTGIQTDLGRKEDAS